MTLLRTLAGHHGAELWTPANLPGLVFLADIWGGAVYDAISGGNLVTANGAAVARIHDGSGNGRHHTQSNASYQGTLLTNAINGLPALRCNAGASHYIYSAGLGSRTDLFVLAVVKPRSLSVNYQAYPISEWNTGGAAGTNSWLLATGSGVANNYQPFSAIEIANLTYGTPASTANQNAWGVYVAWHDKASRALVNRLNGTQTGAIAAPASAPAASMNTVSGRQSIINSIWGAGTPATFAGAHDIAFIMVGFGPITATDMQKAEAWAANKGALAGLFPAGHIARLGPPTV